MKKSLLFLLLLLLPVASYASEYNEFRYSTNTNTNTCTITGLTAACTGDVTIPSILGGCKVTSIGEYAFQNCSSLTSVTIPNSVTSIGRFAFSGCSNLTSITIPNSVTSIQNSAFNNCSGLTSITIPNSVTSIGRFAFNGCTGLTKVTIPNSVTSIGENAFLNCSGLTSITIPNSVTSIQNSAFKNCSSLTSVTIPNSVTSIQNSAFQNCSSLTSIIIPNSVKTIGERTFSGCSNLTSIIINSVTSINESAFEGCTGLISVKVYSKTPFTITDKVFTNRANATLCVPAGSKAAYESAYLWKDFKEIITDPYFLVFSNNLDGNTCSVTGYTDECTGNVTIPSSNGGYSVTSIGKEAFKGCTGLTSITIPNSVTSIGVSAFQNCFDLNSITIPNSVTSIVESAFLNCSNLTSITIPNSVTTISRAAFSYCSKLRSITIPNSVTEISPQAFLGCKGLRSITIPNSVTSIGERAFCACTGLTSITIPNSVTSIGESAFLNCSILTSITIPNSVTSIGESAFMNCSNLTSITIPNSVTFIGQEAFGGCTGLTSITIPNSVTSIGESAFAQCSKLISVTVKAETPLNITYKVFTNRANATLYVPAGSKAAYEAAKYWKEFKEIKEIGMTPPTGITGLIYTGSAQDLINAGVSNMQYSLDGTNYGTTIPQGTDATEYTVYYKAEGNESVSTIKVTISPKTISSPTISLSQASYTYDGTAKEPTVTVKDGETTIPAAEYTVGYSNNTNAGTATVTITDKEGGNYNVSGSATFTIERSVPSGNIVFASDKVKAACVANWDTDEDGELSYAEAAAVTRLIENSNAPFAQLLLDPEFTSFDEFQYFTGITNLFGYEFGDCKNLTSIKLPNSITSIGFGAFINCPLTSIHIPASVTNIHECENELDMPVFCSWSLQTITVDPENTNYSSPTGSNVIIDKTSNTLIVGCRNTDFSKIPNTVTTIAMNAFGGVDFANPAVNLPTSVEAIKSYAFEYSNIKSINLGELTQLTKIGITAFQGCDGLTEVTLPASITTMESEIFAGCDNIVKVVSNREKPLKNNIDLFHIIAIYNNAVLYVPSGKVEAYTNAGWEEPFDDDLKSFRVITDGDHTDPEAIGGLTYNGKDQKLILPGTYRNGMMEYSLDGSTYSTSIPTGKDTGSYTVYYRKVGESNASTLKVTIAAPKTISVFSGSNLWAGYVATENLAIPTGLKAYVITKLDATTATASPLDYIPQGVPVLLKRENTSDNNFEMSAGSGTAPTVNLLKTYDSDKSVSNREGFILYNDEFVLVNEGTLPAGRVFLPANKSGVALTRGIVTEGDDTTGIYNSKMDFDDSDNQWYDIQGRKLERKPTKKGIYILDGRKVVIK